MPIPNRSMSCALPLGAGGAVFAGALFTAVGKAFFAFAACSAAARAFASSSAFSRSRSYPNWRILSASSAALRSASAKLTGAAFFAPRPPSFDFFGAADAVLVLPIEDAEELRREAPSVEAGREPGPAELARKEAELTVRGALPALDDRPMIGGADGFDDVDEVLGAAGLSQEEKKSSSSPLALAGAAADSAPSTTTFSGNLGGYGQGNEQLK